jgi:hypothetical protein
MKNKLLFLLIPLLCAACKPVERVPYSDLAAGLTNLQGIAMLELPATRLISSYDRTGANEDYNHFNGKAVDGQCVLADLEGPGVVSRFWFTGIKPDKKIRFYFDGEKQPRFAFSWNDLRSGIPPFDIEPLSMDEQNCWYTFVPVPFQKRLLITTDDVGYRYGRAPKMYYQLNWSPLPDGMTVESLSPDQDFSKLEEVGLVWNEMKFGPLPEATNGFVLKPGQIAEVWSAKGPATLNAWVMESDISSQDALRNVLIKIHWDGSAEPSVAIPLGDFFGSVWQRWRANSMYFGSEKDGFFTRFPMPFKVSARIVLENQSHESVAFKLGIHQGPYQGGGYFHADWNSSRADEIGKPHVVLNAVGQGRYAGSIVSVVSADQSFWALESDESMLADGKEIWQGTGLEDYFNSGWYYGNVFARPLHGLPNKAPFRTVQYRLHPNEPVLFDQTFKMEFERGPAHASHAAYESVAFYYLEEPQPSGSRLERRMAPVDSLQRQTMMTDLWNFERFGDLKGESEYIDQYIAAYNPPFREVLELRRLACLYEFGQISRTSLLNQLAVSEHPLAATLKALYGDESAVLLQLYCNMKSDLYLDGELLLRAGDPKQPAATLVSLSRGRHVIAVASAWQQYPSWTQVAVRTSKEFLLGTSDEWKHEINPVGNWMQLGYDDSGWKTFGSYSARVKGPPEEPYVWVNPDPFINTCSQAYGLRPSIPWPTKTGRVVYRKEFVVP